MADTECRLLFVVPPKGGHSFTVAALELDGRCEYYAHLSALAKSNRATAAKVVQMLDAIAEHGADIYQRDRTQMEDVGDGLFELKPKDQRLLLFRAGVTWVIVSARAKPKGQKKVQDAWIEEGKRRKKRYLDSLKKRTR